MRTLARRGHSRFVVRTLTLRGGSQVAVVAAEWHDAFGVVTRGRVQLERRNGEPGPVLERDAGFWLQGTGVRALRNPGRRTAKVRIVTPLEQRRRNDMSDSSSIAGPTSYRLGGLVGTGLLAALGAVVATTLAAALARALGVDFELPDGGETIPLPGFAVVTGAFSVVGIVIAVALRRWSARPASRFWWTTVSLTAISLIAPFLSGANTATILTLVGLHLVPAAVMIPALTRSLRDQP